MEKNKKSAYLQTKNPYLESKHFTTVQNIVFTFFFSPTGTMAGCQLPSAVATWQQQNAAVEATGNRRRD